MSVNNHKIQIPHQVCAMNPSDGGAAFWKVVHRDIEKLKSFGIADVYWDETSETVTALRVSDAQVILVENWIFDGENATP